MALIAMAVYDTVENKRSDFTKRTIQSIIETVDLRKHRLIIVDNNSCEETLNIYDYFVGEYGRLSQFNIHIITLPKNVGTANAINEALKYRSPDEFFIKMDNDVVFHKKDWVDEMEEAMKRMPRIGVLGLKRKDVCESVYSINIDQRSKLIEVPHETGQRWYVVEECKHVMGTCTMLSPALLGKVGYFYQMDGLYGFDDSLMCVRAKLAGFMNCFFHGVEIDHIDPGGSEYTKWKEQYAQEMILKYAETERLYNKGSMDIYYNPFPNFSFI